MKDAKGKKIKKKSFAAENSLRTHERNSDIVFIIILCFAFMATRFFVTRRFDDILRSYRYRCTRKEIYFVHYSPRWTINFIYSSGMLCLWIEFELFGGIRGTGKLSSARNEFGEFGDSRQKLHIFKFFKSWKNEKKLFLWKTIEHSRNSGIVALKLFNENFELKYILQEKSLNNPATTALVWPKHSLTMSTAPQQIKMTLLWLQ